MADDDKRDEPTDEEPGAGDEVPHSPARAYGRPAPRR